ncbi:MAG: SemiSWEET family transporter [Hyphomonadaceae bacterium]
MHADSTELLGLVAGFIGAFAFAPQAFKIIRDRDASGVSALTYAMVLTGALLWGTYGLLRGAPSIIIWNAVAAALAALVLILKVRGARSPA